MYPSKSYKICAVPSLRSAILGWVGHRPKRDDVRHDAQAKMRAERTKQSALGIWTCADNIRRRSNRALNQNQEKKPDADAH